MSQIPQNTVTQDDINEWYKLNEELGKIKAKELLLRNKIFKGMFLNPEEGTNTLPLSAGWVIKGKMVINRSVDRAALSTLTPELQEKGINISQLIEYKPELKLSEYRKLTAEQQRDFDHVLVIKPGTPGLEIMLPKKNQPKA